MLKTYKYKYDIKNSFYFETKEILYTKSNVYLDKMLSN